MVPLLSCTVNAIRFAELPVPSVTFSASSFVGFPRTKKVCKRLCALDAVFKSFSWSKKRTATRAKSLTSDVELKGVEKKSDVVEMTLDEVDDDSSVVVVVGFDLITSLELSAPVRPSKVTRAFSDTQERFAELKRAKTRLGSRGMLKFACASERRRGME